METDFSLISTVEYTYYGFSRCHWYMHVLCIFLGYAEYLNLLTIIGMFCRIIDKVLLKIVGQLASSVEYKPRSHRNSKENLGEEGYFYDYNIRAKCLLHIFCYCSFMWSVLQVRLRNWQE